MAEVVARFGHLKIVPTFAQSELSVWGPRLSGVT